MVPQLLQTMATRSGCGTKRPVNFSVHSIWVWDQASGQLLSALDLPPVSSLANAGFHSDRLFYTLDFNGNVVIWDPRGWNETIRFSYPGRIESGMLFPDGQAIALQDRKKNQISIYDLTGAEIRITKFVGENAHLLSISPDGDRFMLHVDLGLPSERVEMISADSGATLLELPLLNFRRFAISDEWDLLAAIGVSSELRLFELPDGRQLLSQQVDLRQTLGLEISPSGEYLGLVGRSVQDGGGVIQVWGRSTEAP
jgi:WD40 repeat protein